MEIGLVAFEGGQNDVVADGVELIGFEDGKEEGKDVREHVVEERTVRVLDREGE